LSWSDAELAADDDELEEESEESEELEDSEELERRRFRARHAERYFTFVVLALCAPLAKETTALNCFIESV